MRFVPWLGGLALVLALGSPAVAQTAPYTARITQPEAEVRCGPSTDPQIYPTNRLRRGDPVEVVEELPTGWLRIKPPAGSFSFINTRFVQRIPNNANQSVWVVVTQPGVRIDVYVGSELKPAQEGRPKVVGARVVRGQQLRGVGPELGDEEGTWLPIEPPPGEYRYLRAEALSRTDAPGAGVVAAGAVRVPERTPAEAPATPPAVRMPPAQVVVGAKAEQDNQMAHAQDLERGGRYEEAIQQYQIVAREAAASNPPLAQEALSRAHQLERLHTGAAASGYRPGPAAPDDFRYTSLPGASRTSEIPSAPAAPPPNVRLTPPAQATAPPPNPANRPASTSWSSRPADPATPSSGPGSLRRSGRNVEGRPTYVLDSSIGNPPLYVTPAQGLDLEPYVGTSVELFGPMMYHGELKTNFMNATRVQPLQPSP